MRSAEFSGAFVVSVSRGRQTDGFETSVERVVDGGVVREARCASEAGREEV